MNYIFFFGVICAFFSFVYGECSYPYPQQITYSGAIKPNNVTQDSMNKSVSDYYDWWKGFYLKESNGGTLGGGYYVKYINTYNGKNKSVSEAHGYGMIILVLMAGYDEDAKKLYDGMYNIYDKHRSTINNNLMSWILSDDESVERDDDCASDGDMDIAYSLLLADLQWGSDGAINYLSEAKRIIDKGIKASLIDDLYRIRLGDWATSGEYINTTRPSDWMPGHIKAYREVTGDIFWDNVRDSIYSMVEHLQLNYSPYCGLLPDFVVGELAMPSKPFFLESEFDGEFNWNSCRTPWRIATDYIHNDNSNAKTTVSKMMDWIVATTNGDPSLIYTGYTLQGELLVEEESWNKSNAFTAPFITGSMVDAKYQDFLNKGWGIIKEDKSGAYFGNTINLLNMLMVSGNWWSPNGVINSNIKDNNVAIDALDFDIDRVFPNPFNPKVNISFNVFKNQEINLSVYDIKGRLVKSIMSENMSRGKYMRNWDGVDFSGMKVSSGIYFVRLFGESRIITRKLILLK